MIVLINFEQQRRWGGGVGGGGTVLGRPSEHSSVVVLMLCDGVEAEIAEVLFASTYSCSIKLFIWCRAEPNCFVLACPADLPPLFSLGAPRPPPVHADPETRVILPRRDVSFFDCDCWSARGRALALLA